MNISRMLAKKIDGRLAFIAVNTMESIKVIQMDALQEQILCKSNNQFKFQLAVRKHGRIRFLDTWNPSSCQHVYFEQWKWQAACGIYIYLESRERQKIAKKL